MKQGLKMKQGLIGFLLFFSVSILNAEEFNLLLDNIPSQRPITENISTNTSGISVKINSDIKSASAGDYILFENQAGKTYRISLEKKKNHRNGDTTIIGYIDGTNHRVIITQGSAGSSAIINTEDGKYKIELHNNKEQLLTPAELESYIEGGHEDDGIIPDFSRVKKSYKNNTFETAVKRHFKSQNKTFETANSPPAGIATIDIMVLYTADLQSRLGSINAVESRINQLVAISNTAYVDSEMSIELRLVHSEQINADNDSASGTALVNMQSGAGVFAGVSALRSSKGADMVILLRDYKELHNGSCGIAYILGNQATGTMPNSEKSYAFSVVQDGSYQSGIFTYFCNNYSLSHELGHNFGFAHDRDHAGVPGLFDYSYGHDNPNTFSTIMSYDKPKLGKFSNPNIDCNGEPCGIAEGQPNSADNAKSGNLVRHDLAAFYPTVVGVADAGTSLVSVSPSSVVADDMATSLITVQLKDSSGNNLTNGGDSVTLSSTGSAELSTVSDNTNGSYSATVSNAVIENITISATVNSVLITDTAVVNFYDSTFNPAGIITVLQLLLLNQ